MDEKIEHNFAKTSFKSSTQTSMSLKHGSCHSKHMYVGYRKLMLSLF